MVGSTNQVGKYLLAGILNTTTWLVDTFNQLCVASYQD